MFDQPLSPVLLDVVIAALIALAGAGVVGLRRFVSAVRWARFLRGGHDAPISVVTGQIRFPNHNHRYMAGGDIDSLVQASMSTAAIAPKAKLNHVFSDELTPTIYRGNLIVIGGPKYNKLTEMSLEKTSEFLPVGFDGNSIVTKLPSLEEWAGNVFSSKVAEKPSVIKHYTCQKSEGLVVEDFGLLIRCLNPFDPNCKSVLWCIAGSGSNGCLAAAELFKQVAYDNSAYSKKLRRAIRGGDSSMSIVRAVMSEGKFVTISPILTYTSKSIMGYKYYKMIVPILGGKVDRYYLRNPKGLWPKITKAKDAAVLP